MPRLRVNVLKTGVLLLVLWGFRLYADPTETVYKKYISITKDSFIHAHWAEGYETHVSLSSFDSTELEIAQAFRLIGLEWKENSPVYECSFSFLRYRLLQFSMYPAAYRNRLDELMRLLGGKISFQANDVHGEGVLERVNVFTSITKISDSFGTPPKFSHRIHISFEKDLRNSISVRVAGKLVNIRLSDLQEFHYVGSTCREAIELAAVN